MNSPLRTEPPHSARAGPRDSNVLPYDHGLIGSAGAQLMNARDATDLRLTVGIAIDDQGESRLVGVPGVCAVLLV